MTDSEQEISNILQEFHSKLDDIANESIGDHQLKRKLFIIKIFESESDSESDSENDSEYDSENELKKSYTTY